MRILDLFSGTHSLANTARPLGRAQGAEEWEGGGEGGRGEARVGDVARAVASASALRLLLARAKQAL